VCCVLVPIRVRVVQPDALEFGDDDRELDLLPREEAVRMMLVCDPLTGCVAGQAARSER
jgi:hypothetical protein